MVTYCSLGLLLVYIGTIILTVEGCPNNQVQCDNGNCIPETWLCDDEDDCGDGSDETGCEHRTCSGSEMKCDNLVCIPARWQCDGDDDCGDNSDEETNMCGMKTCSANQFSCLIGDNCISLSWQCDGEADCDDRSDEENCHSFTCASNEFACQDHTKCITTRWVCDGEADCDDASDEAACGPPSCATDQFQCDGARNCIPDNWRCDSDHDCEDSSDEAGCAETPGLGEVTADECVGLFTCGDGSCIHRAWQCDSEIDCDDGTDEVGCSGTCSPYEIVCDDGSCAFGIICDGTLDCGDGSDESSCDDTPPPSLSSCLEAEFRCNDGTCLNESRVCDGTEDCLAGEDEPTDRSCDRINECESSPCSHDCHEHPIVGHTCSCRAGFRTDAADSSACVEINECLQVPAVCAQECINKHGSYKCDCYEGFVVHDDDRHACKAMGARPAIYYAYGQGIRKFNGSGVVEEHEEIYSGLGIPMAIDMDIANERLFWSDVKQEQIMMGSSAPAGLDAASPTVLLNGTGRADGIAYDWIHANLYWADADQDTISVVNVLTLETTVIVNEGLDEPRGIVVDPRTGYMYWSDWGDHPKIERAGMDGTDVQLIVDDTTCEIFWPNGLAIDYYAHRLFWVDARHHTLTSCDFDGNDMRVVLHDRRVLEHPFHLAVFEGMAYWTDWDAEAIRSVDQVTGADWADRVPHLANARPHGIRLWHPTQQPEASNKCGSDNGGCSHLCVVAPLQGDEVEAHSCLCPAGLILAEDGLACVDPAGPPAPVVHATPGPPAVGRTDPTGTRTVTYRMVNGDKNGTGVVIEPVTPDARKESPTDGNSITLIVGVVLAACVVCLIVLGLAFLMWRRHAASGKRSMNFDNPVYRKTTEDEVFLNTKPTYEHNPGKGSYQPMITTDDGIM